MPRKKYRENILVNAFSLLRMFMVKPKSGVKLMMEFEETFYETVSGKDGFFRFEWKPEKGLSPGFHTVSVSLVNPIHKKLAFASSEIIIPHPNQYAFISDIDDTFLISHSSNLRKRLFVLLTENARTRIPFEGVAHHYHLLACSHAPRGTVNPFFYVSSSEWNLYDYIQEFAHNAHMPKAVFLLNQLKGLSEILNTGQNNHRTKFFRITRILEAYPEQTFVLLGDDSQADPEIYRSVVSHFPERIFAVYIRHVGRKEKTAAKELLTEMEKEGVFCCYFKHSREAIEHSVSVGLVTREEADRKYILPVDAE
jgi:phosphatidate phosphatase APP1